MSPMIELMMAKSQKGVVLNPLAQYIKDSIVQGYKEGEAKGEAKGKAEGLEMAISTYMLKQPNVSDADIADLFEVPVSKEKRLRKSLTDK